MVLVLVHVRILRLHHEVMMTFLVLAALLSKAKIIKKFVTVKNNAFYEKASPPALAFAARAPTAALAEPPPAPAAREGDLDGCAADPHSKVYQVASPPPAPLAPALCQALPPEAPAVGSAGEWGVGGGGAVPNRPAKWAGEGPAVEFARVLAAPIFIDRASPNPAQSFGTSSAFLTPPGLPFPLPPPSGPFGG